MVITGHKFPEGIAWLCWFVFVANAAPGSEEPVAPKSDAQRYFERVIRTVEPDLTGSADRLPAYLEVFGRNLMSDTRLFPYHVEAVQTIDGHITLKGSVGFDENRTALAMFLSCLEFRSIDNRVEVLPGDVLGEKRFGFVRTTHSFSYDRPEDSAEVLTDCILGTPLFLLAEAENGYFLCHAMEGYVGYVSGSDIHRVNGRSFGEYQSGVHVRVLRNYKTTSRLVVPIGSRLKLVNRDPDRIVVALPDGTHASIPVDLCRVDTVDPNPRIERIVSAVESFLGTPYVWGGNTSEGIDCSGLVQTAFATEGIVLARDSNQQVLAGRLVATRWYREGLRRGDTLYFLGEHGKIRHTALYLGDGRYIEAVRPVVRYSSFNPSDPEYSERGAARFCFGKRLLD